MGSNPNTALKLWWIAMIQLGHVWFVSSLDQRLHLHVQNRNFCHLGRCRSDHQQWRNPTTTSIMLSSWSNYQCHDVCRYRNRRRANDRRGFKPLRQQQPTQRTHRLSSLVRNLSGGGEGGSLTSRSLSTSSSSDDNINEPVAPNKSSNNLAASYHLIWNDGFGTKFGLSTLILVGIAQLFKVVGWNISISSIVPSFHHGTLSSMMGLLSLLASSCCLIQVMANVLVGTVGCLGLNTSFLGPSRPYFLSLLVYLSVTTTTFSSSWTKSLPQILLRAMITFLPEMLHVWNTRVKPFISNKRNEHLLSNMSSSSHATLQFDVPTMGCVACINKIDQTLQTMEIELDNPSSSTTDDSVSPPTPSPTKPTTTRRRPLSVTSWLDPQSPKGGSTKVSIAVTSEEEAEQVRQSVIEHLDHIGFGGSTMSKIEFS